MWWKIGPRRHKIAEVMHLLGAPVRSQAAECSFSRARARKKKSRPITGIHQGAAKEPSRSTLLDPMAPGMLKKEKKEQKEQPGTWDEG